MFLSNGDDKWIKHLVRTRDLSVDMLMDKKKNYHMPQIYMIQQHMVKVPDNRGYKEENT